MKDERDIRSIRAKAIETARDIVAERTGVIEGSRVMQKLLWQAEVSEDDNDLLSFMGIDSETDDLPVGEERQYWSLEALKEKDAEIMRCEDLYRKTALEACENIIRRWKDMV